MDVVLRREFSSQTDRMVEVLKRMGVAVWLHAGGDGLGVIFCGGIPPDTLKRVRNLREVEWVGDVSQAELEAVPVDDPGPVRQLRRLRASMGDFGPDDPDCGPVVRQMILDARAGESGLDRSGLDTAD